VLGMVMVMGMEGQGYPIQAVLQQADQAIVDQTIPWPHLALVSPHPRI